VGRRLGHYALATALASYRCDLDIFVR